MTVTFKANLLFLFLFSAVFANAQNTPLSLSLGISFNECRIDPLLIQKAADGSSQHNPSIPSISRIRCHNTAVNLRLDSSWTLGLSYSLGSTMMASGRRQSVTMGDTSNPYPYTFELISSCKIVTRTISLKPSYSFRKLFGMNNSVFKVFKNMDLKLALELGYGWMQESANIDNLEALPVFYQRNFMVVTDSKTWTGNTFSLAPALQIEYPLFGKVVLLGLETGYRTEVFTAMKDSDGNKWKLKGYSDSSAPASALSGVYAAPYLRMLF